MNTVIRAQGFTLLELTIVMAIIGVLSAIAIPNFSSYQRKAYQAEAHVILGAIASSQMQHKLRTGVFVSCPLNPLKRGESWNSSMPEWDRISLNFKGKLRYQYEVLADEIGFVAYARSNLDADPTIDEWKISSKHLTPVQVSDDIKK